MTDKIDPGWVSDRLPTEEDGNAKKGYVIIMLHGLPYAENYTWVNEGQDWCVVPKEITWQEDWQNLIYTPDECLAREQGKAIVIIGKIEEPYPSQQHWLAKTERLAKALEKSEERVKEGCRKISDLIDENTELLEDTDAEDKYDLLKQLLIKEWKD